MSKSAAAASEVATSSDEQSFEAPLCSVLHSLPYINSKERSKKSSRYGVSKSTSGCFFDQKPKRHGPLRGPNDFQDVSVSEPS